MSLVGYSIGARVVYTCLLTLAEMALTGHYVDADGNKVSAAEYASVDSIVQNATLISAPVPNDRASWEAIRKVVSGRVINGFTSKDWLLGVVHRSTALASSCAGMVQVPAEGIESLDMSQRCEEVTGTKLRKNLGKIMKSFLQRK